MVKRENLATGFSIHYYVKMKEKMGLSRGRAGELLVQFGPNEVGDEEGTGWWRVLAAQFDNLLIWLLILAGGVSLGLGERVDAGLIWAIVILNAGFGFYQEFRAGRAIAALKKMTIVRVRVVRDGREEEVDSRVLVPGDVVYLEQGTKVPADGVMLDGKSLEVDEAALTGESLPVEKTEVFMGTIVARGRGYMEVTCTGKNSRFGQIAGKLGQVVEVKTPWQKRIEKFARQMGVVGIIAATMVFGMSFVRDRSLGESFLFAVSLAVAAVPEGLPAVVTVTLAIGGERMARKKAVVRKLAAIETLGAVSLVMTDKTGTLTANKMRVKEVRMEGAEAKERMLLDAVMCSTASTVVKLDHGEPDVIGDPTEGALLLWAQKEGIDVNEVRRTWRVVEEVPFDPVTRKMAVTVDKGGRKYELAKGAPEAILAGCTLAEKRRREIETELQVYARKGLRLLAFSAGKKFLGWVGLADPVRPEVKEAILAAGLAGIKVVMVTGDNELTAEAVGVETGIIGEGGEILTGRQVDEYSDEQLVSVLARVKIFARTTPEHKYRLVQLYQQMGETVAVTGDGVNDALALKQAEVGVAMGITGTDVAREAADMVITDDNFASLMAAVEEGRNIFAQLRGVVKFMVACNLGEVGYILAAVTLGLPVLSPLQILYVNLVTDGLPALAFAFAPGRAGVLREKPGGDRGFLDRKEWRYLLGAGGLTAAVGLIVVLPVWGWSVVQRATMAFTGIIFIQPLVLIDTWLGHRPVWRHLKLLGQPVLVAAVVMPIVLHPLVLYWRPIADIMGMEALGISQLVYVAGVAGAAGWVILGRRGKSW